MANEKLAAIITSPTVDIMLPMTQPVEVHILRLKACEISRGIESFIFESLNALLNKFF